MCTPGVYCARSLDGWFRSHACAHVNLERGGASGAWMPGSPLGRRGYLRATPTHAHFALALSIDKPPTPPRTQTRLLQEYQWSGQMTAVSRVKSAVRIPEGTSFEQYLLLPMPEDVAAETGVDTNAKPDRSRIWVKKAARVRRRSGPAGTSLPGNAAGLLAHRAPGCLFAWAWGLERDGAPKPPSPVRVRRCCRRVESKWTERRPGPGRWSRGAGWPRWGCSGCRVPRRYRFARQASGSVRVSADPTAPLSHAPHAPELPARAPAAAPAARGVGRGQPTPGSSGRRDAAVV